MERQAVEVADAIYARKAAEIRASQSAYGRRSESLVALAYTWHTDYQQYLYANYPYEARYRYDDIRRMSTELQMLRPYRMATGARKHAELQLLCAKMAQNHSFGSVYGAAYNKDLVAVFSRQLLDECITECDYLINSGTVSLTAVARTQYARLWLELRQAKQQRLEQEEAQRYVDAGARALLARSLPDDVVQRELQAFVSPYVPVADAFQRQLDTLREFADALVQAGDSVTQLQSKAVLLDAQKVFAAVTGDKQADAARLVGALDVLQRHINQGHAFVQSELLAMLDTVRPIQRYVEW